ncbi:N-acetyl-D-Glu racemase DgcA [Mesorhizobium xinjiangense]|uniref:N-acetyl-D-Glu racemase DgcA n=1 Tax=Mesorhizobium xinjiangense TaxID=2678685 RepID=UPI0012ED6E1F|nr:N-acetyl-D-Glu racemase DgcA [Mesorhizobium xinjiangense]
MSRRMDYQVESFPIEGQFRISRGAKTQADVVTCRITDGIHSGQGECVPYARYGESMDSVADTLEKARAEIEKGIGRTELLEAMAPGAARNAVDCALWDLEAKMIGHRAHQKACHILPRPVVTAVTISLDEPGEMAAQARANALRPLLKVKVGSTNDVARIHAVASAAPNSRIILDANEGWTEDNIKENLLAAAQFHVALVEQPLPAGKDEILRHMPHPVPICADESVHTAERLDELNGLYDAVNIKLDKTGGLTAAIQLRQEARARGYGVMVGCMVGTSLAMAPAVLLAQDADYVDLDGPLLLARDRAPGLTYAGSLISPPEPALWG